MRHDQVMPGAPRAPYRRAAVEEQEESLISARFGPLVRVLLGLLIAVDISLLVPPLYYATLNPCNMVALANASRHSNAVDDEIVLSDEIARDVYYVSSAWTRSRVGLASCAGNIGGRTLAAVVP